MDRYYTNVELGYGIAYLVLAPPTIIANLLVMIAISTTPSLRTPAFILLCGLAVSDLGVGICGFLLLGILKVTEKSLNINNEVNKVVLHFVAVSLFTIIAVSIDRFIALYCHLRYTVIVTKTRVAAVHVAIWVTAVAIAVLPYFTTEYGKIRGILMLFLMVANFVLSFKIYQVVRRHHRLICIHDRIQFNQETIVRMRRRKASFDVLYIYAVFLVCNTPCVIWILLLQFINDPEGKDSFMLRSANIIFFLLYLNSLFNPILFCYRIKQIRRAVFSFLFCRSHSPER
ncbi:melanocyte-stimulating hormone receptor-like [Nematostella vectensis]|uniref:melanocyte-stimulating hormone receptor-like n=1 Tax=Nematostella vectensis TaxID=45351 RepID=UPI00207725BC|nr:melanocyte-stimulating hormone receptor-like [Nematostella vectensis]